MEVSDGSGISSDFVPCCGIWSRFLFS
jgi:hypothetical protein